MVRGMMKNVRVEEGYTIKRLKIETGITGIPDYIASSGEEFIKLVALIEQKFGEKQESDKTSKSLSGDR